MIKLAQEIDTHKKKIIWICAFMSFEDGLKRLQIVYMLYFGKISYI